jgi:hypothetical protein
MLSEPERIKPLICHTLLQNKQPDMRKELLVRLIKKMGDLHFVIFEKQSRSALERLSPYNKGYVKALDDVANLIDILICEERP